MFSIVREENPGLPVFVFREIGDSVSIGRDPQKCAIALDSQAPGVSRVHLVFTCRKSACDDRPQLVVIDHSTHGTVWNSRRARASQTHRDRPVNVGDRFMVGEYRFVVASGGGVDKGACENKTKASLNEMVPAGSTVSKKQQNEEKAAADDDDDVVVLCQSQPAKQATQTKRTTVIRADEKRARDHSVVGENGAESKVVLDFPPLAANCSTARTVNAKSKRARFLGAGDACEEEEAIDFDAPILAADTLDVEDVLPPPRHRRELHQPRNEKKASKTRSVLSLDPEADLELLLNESPAPLASSLADFNSQMPPPIPAFSSTQIDHVTMFGNGDGNNTSHRSVTLLDALREIHSPEKVANFHESQMESPDIIDVTPAPIGNKRDDNAAKKKRGGIVNSATSKPSPSTSNRSSSSLNRSGTITNWMQPGRQTAQRRIHEEAGEADGQKKRDSRLPTSEAKRIKLEETSVNHGEEADGGDGVPRGGNGGYFLLQSQAMHTNVRVGNDIEMFSESPQEAGDEFDEDLVAKKLASAIEFVRLVKSGDRENNSSVSHSAVSVCSNDNHRGINFKKFRKASQGCFAKKWGDASSISSPAFSPRTFPPLRAATPPSRCGDRGSQMSDDQ